MSEEKKDQKIKITVDNEQTKALAEELARERIKNDKLVDKIASNEVKEDHNDLATRKLQAFEKFHNENFLHAETTSELSQMITNYINDIASKGKGEPSGSAPANAQQYGAKPEDLYTKPYSSYQEMVQDLRKKSAEGNPEAKQYLDSLIKKWILDKRENPTRPEPSFNPNTPESLSDLDLVQKGENLTPQNKEDGDLQRLQKRWREERKRRMEGKSD